MAKPAHISNKDGTLDDKKRVLTKAFIRMSYALALKRQELSGIIGKSEASLSRVFTQENFLIDPDSKEGQLVLLLLRLYRSLETMFGGNTEQAKLWLRSQNAHLNAVPIDLIQSIQGLVMTVQYLDAMRGKN